ncbi:hypothetical protein AG4045_003475 [Apium graveolens]|uniref:Uncharacterized protein n=1 Tax=Apium graveolens TaxID=4045 RepID=A0A6L5B8R4_APIGR|nr:hypothetical protein AG4045_003475 [Apium graveolens]
MDSGTLVIVIWVGVVFASIICTAAYFGGLGGAIKRWFSGTFVARVAAVTPVDTLQLSEPGTADPDVEKGEIDVKITSAGTKDEKTVTVAVAEKIGSATKPFR